MSNHNFINVGYQFAHIDYSEPPFDIKKAVFDASSIGGIIYVHPFLFSSVYKWMNEHIDRPYSIDPHGVGLGMGEIKIVVTDLLQENEFRVMTDLEFLKEFDNGTS